MLQHQCKFDFKALGKAQLAASSPKVTGDKLERL